ncbi:MAG: hypothetical protein ACLFU7_11990 [Armatimonadota bacterium]
MASTNQNTRRNADPDRARQKRLAWLIVLTFALIAWGPRTAVMLEKGWSSSHAALERQQQIDEAERRIEALQREVAYARTSEGKDVEAKRRFGVGPRDEIWITVEAQQAPEQRPQSQSVADRLNVWLTDAGSRFVGHLRAVGATVSYAVGLRDVSTSVAVPVIEDLEIAETSDEDSAENTGGDGEIAGDAADGQ